MLRQRGEQRRSHRTFRRFAIAARRDRPVVGDWDSSGTPNKIGVYRNGLWILDYDGDNAMTVLILNELVVALGSAGAQPLVF